MSLVKTDKGRLALQKRDSALGPKERQILILANGNRGLAHYKELMGETVTLAIAGLIRHGYLTHASSPLAQASAVQHAAAIQVALPESSQPSVEAAVLGQRRKSMAAVKMYVIDMLQMMRDMDASAHAADLQATAGTPDFVPALMQALWFVRERSGAAYGLRVGLRLSEVMPQENMPELEAFMSQCQTDAQQLNFSSAGSAATDARA